MAALKVDDALKAGTDIGPVVDERQLEQDLKYIELGKKEGARLVAGREPARTRKAGLLPGAGAVHRHARRR